jgi:short-subunit dehydrogenase
MNPIAIVTGASAGIGAELARVFARNGHTVMLVARREDRLRQLADRIAVPGQPKPLVLALDLAGRNAAEAIKSALQQNGCEAQYVVNNAGFSVIGPAADVDRAEQLAMIDVNMRALLDLSLAFTDDLVKNRGGILNVGSLAGVMPGPGAAVYYASKAFVVSFTEALHRELAPRRVRVTVLCPGPVPTGFQARAGIHGEEAGSVLTRSAAEVARAGYEGLMAGRRRVVPGWPNRLVTGLVSLAPRDLVLRLVEGRHKQRLPGSAQ